MKSCTLCYQASGLSTPAAGERRSPPIKRAVTLAGRRFRCRIEPDFPDGRIRPWDDSCTPPRYSSRPSLGFCLRRRIIVGTYARNDNARGAREKASYRLITPSRKTGSAPLSPIKSPSKNRPCRAVPRSPCHPRSYAPCSIRSLRCPALPSGPMANRAREEDESCLTIC